MLRRWAVYPYQLGAPDEEHGAPVGAPGTKGRTRPSFKFNLPPFGRLALVHTLSSAGDAMVAIALANSVFFNVSANAAKNKVALSLALTVAPFAVVGPLLGPMVGRARGGRRAMAIGSAVGRAGCCLFMAFWVKSVALFPVAFFTLVFSKLYLVTKAAIVPGTVERQEQLVLANSKLSVAGSVASVLAGSAGVGVMYLLGARGLLRFDIAVYLACAWGAAVLTTVQKTLPSVTPVLGAQPTPAAPAPGPGMAQPVVASPLPQLPSPASPLRPPPAAGLPPGGLQLAAVATAALRLSVGFVTFLLVFTFRRHDAALIWYGLALGASQVGNLTGALVAPRVRRRAPEEWMLTVSSAVVGTAALLAGAVHWGTHWFVAVVLAAGIGVAAAAGKLAFDSMVQRDVPSHVRGRSFARFESGFQLAWAVGGLLAVLVPMTLAEGFVGIGVVGLLGAAAFAGGSVKARRGTLPAWFPGSAPRPVASPVRGPDK